jgi:hypothetical protein
VVVNDVLCFGDNTGSINITATSGTPAYRFSISGVAPYQNSNIFSGLVSGNYTLAVIDALNCSSLYSFNPVLVDEPPLLTASATSTDASCANVFDGSITVTANGGLGTCSYSLNGGPNQPSNTFNNVAAGSYVILVTDGNNCTTTTNVIVGNQYTVTATLDSVKPVSCFGGTDGEV